MKIRALAIAALTLALPFAAVACGGSDDTNSGSRPTAKEIATALKKDPTTTGVPADIITCLGEKIEASDLPNGVLRALVKGEEAQIDKDNEDEYNKIVADAADGCTGGSGTSVPE